MTEKNINSELRLGSPLYCVWDGKIEHYNVFSISYVDENLEDIEVCVNPYHELYGHKDDDILVNSSCGYREVMYVNYTDAEKALKIQQSK